MSQEERLRSRSEKAQGDSVRSNEEAAAISSESATLIRASANGFKDKAARDAHIARSAALDKRVAAFNAKSKQIRLSLADLQTSQAEYLRSCGGKSFYIEDRNFILAERATSNKPPSATDPGASAPAQN